MAYARHLRGLSDDVFYDNLAVVAKVRYIVGDKNSSTVSRCDNQGDDP